MSPTKDPKKATQVRDVTAEYRVAPAQPEPDRVVSIREFKTRASEILRDLERTGAEALITRRGTPWGRLIPVAHPGQPKGPKRLLRDSYPSLPDLAEADFQEAKALWTPSPATGEERPN